MLTRISGPEISPRDALREKMYTAISVFDMGFEKFIANLLNMSIRFEVTQLRCLSCFRR